MWATLRGNSERGVVLVLAPPLTITEEQVKEGMLLLQTALVNAPQQICPPQLTFG